MIACSVAEPSQVAEARRVGSQFARSNGFDEDSAGRVALVATELATNLLKHAGGGHLLVGTFANRDESGIELLAIDRGPGIGNLEAALQDGVSTAGTSGNGLGAVRRLSHYFDVYSQLGKGTAVLARLERGRNLKQGSRETRQCAWGAVCVPYPGELVSGDSWAVHDDANGTTLMVADGLGHGPAAAEAASQAVRLFDKCWREKPVEALELMHHGLRPTRGAAVAIARLDYARNCVTFAGIGNISGTVFFGAGQSRRMLSHNGTLGHAARKFQEFEYPVENARGASIVMHSDGIGTSWSVMGYPGILDAHPTLMAAVIYRDFARGRDDATVLVARGEKS